ncbi:MULTISPECIES: IclR family transcriptional regulator [unclassified Streptomyces]|uniref:IclR family transcriptional regulator n=1 Tax=unclassified Streptomyces TaxID=2593676 RepID=UPI00278C4169|nr:MULTISPECIES: IclR family transcriptional regulator [unclassified Streptomyces]
MAERIQSVERAALVLRLLASGPRQFALTELARAMGLSEGELRGILGTLVTAGLVEQDPATGKYRIGAALLHLSNGDLDANELRARSLHSADTLAARSGESVWIGTPHEEQVLVVHHVFRPDGSAQVLRMGDHVPLHATAIGKTLLAFDHDLDVPEKLPPFTDRTLTERAALAAELYEIRRRGWAAAIDEHTEGESAIGAPVRDASGRTVGALSIAGPTHRLTDSGHPRAALAAQVTDAAGEIGRALAR